jgi:2-oxoglutarate ferredoxin oxidoreductase subunit delta
MEKVRIKREYCKGCGLCVKACMRNVLEATEDSNAMGYRYIGVKDGERCTSCTLCAVMCPEAAIEIYR